MVFALNSLVWLKQPDYPWWPGVVLDPAALEMTIPVGYDTCVLCLPSASSSVAFANSNNSGEILPFNPSSDAALFEEGRKDSQCAAAVEEALSVYGQQQQQQMGEVEEGGKRRKKEDRHRKPKKEHVDETHSLTTAKKDENKRRESRDRQESPLRKHRNRHRHHHHHHHRKLHGDERKRGRKQHESDDEDDDFGQLSSGDEDGKKRGKHRATAMHRSEKLSDMDQIENGAQPMFVHDEDDAMYLEHMFRKRRTAATDSALKNICLQLNHLATACVSSVGVVYVSRALEEQLLDALSPLTLTSVTFEQLRRTKIGVVVGRFLSSEYPIRVVSLALAILTYWFRHLPQEIQQSLIKQSSLKTTALGSGHQRNAT